MSFSANRILMTTSYRLRVAVFRRSDQIVFSEVIKKFHLQLCDYSCSKSNITLQSFHCVICESFETVCYFFVFFPSSLLCASYERQILG